MGLPKTIREIALRHQINVVHLSGAGGHYDVHDPKTDVTRETKRTKHLKVCHALAMRRQYLHATKHCVICQDPCAGVSMNFPCVPPLSTKSLYTKSMLTRSENMNSGTGGPVMVRGLVARGSVRAGRVHV